MFAMTRYLRAKLIDHSLGKTSWTKPTSTWLGLHTADPTEAGSLANEISGGSYDRVQVDSIMTAADTTEGISINNALFTFPTATADWGDLTHVSISDASSAGNMLFFGELSLGITILSGMSFELQPGAVMVRFR